MTLGHLPHAAFERAIDHGWVLVAERGAAVVGYLLYGVRQATNDARVDHLALTATAVRSGIARALVERLLEDISDLRRVVLKCRQDYPGHAFWLRMGFEAVGETVGKSRQGLLLTQFERRLQYDATLFDALHEESAAFALDLNVLLDLAAERNQETVDIFRQLDQFDVHPVRTASLSNELLKCPDIAVRERARLLSSGWVWPPAPVDQERLMQLQELIPEADKDDLRHLASAEAAGAEVLITQDAALIEAAAATAHDVTSVEVLHPAQYLDRLFRGGGPHYTPTFARGLGMEAASSFTQGVLAEAFVASNHGESKARFRAILARGLADGAADAGCLTYEGRPVCLYILRSREHESEIELLRFADGSDRATVLRQALANLRKLVASESHVTVLRLTEPLLRPRDAGVLRAEGFVPVESGWSANPIGGVQTIEEVSRLVCWDGPVDVAPELKELLDQVDVSSEAQGLAETLLDPLLIVGGAMPAVVVPIQDRWSDLLIGPTQEQLEFDIASARIRQLREHVYFRSPRGPALTAPSRVFWYRTRKSGTSRIFATSVIEQILVRPVPEAWGRFGGYGVLNRSDIDDRADETGHVMAFRFCRTRRLSREVSLSELRDVAALLGASKPAVPVGPLKLDPRLHSWLLREVGPE
ncbi:MAG: GNAT family N-acetyltransferase [Acidimicrobiia bacterium]|nr:GNAT family N-acetyltransferase [Acidimicrobiia bacterium]